MKMSSTMKKTVGLIAAAVLAGSLLVLAGCASSSASSSASASASSASASAASTSASATSASASAASTSAASASATSASATAQSASAAAQSAAAASASQAAASSESAEIANPWHDAASAEEAAKGAGLDAFPIPEGELGDLGKIFEVSYRYMDGMAEARLQLAASVVTVRTAKIGAEDSFDISGDYNTYKYEWTEYIANMPIACAGNREGDSIKTFWGEDGIAHSIVAQGGGGDADFGLNANRLAVVVEAMI